MNWDRFDQKIFIQAKSSVIYDAFATSKGMESWFLRKCTYIREENVLFGKDYVKSGDQYHFLWHGWDDATYEKGVFLQANGYDMIEFTFNGNGATDMNVKVSIEKYDLGVLVVLNQYNIPDTEDGKSLWHLGCKTGWNFYLINLKAVIEHGIDLRNKDLKLTGVLNC